jgi:hypothetical protein
MDGVQEMGYLGPNNVRSFFIHLLFKWGENRYNRHLHNSVNILNLVQITLYLRVCSEIIRHFFLVKNALAQSVFTTLRSTPPAILFIAYLTYMVFRQSDIRLFSGDFVLIIRITIAITFIPKILQLCCTKLWKADMSICM